jgi:hypothetical protein
MNRTHLTPAVWRSEMVLEWRVSAARARSRVAFAALPQVLQPFGRGHNSLTNQLRPLQSYSSSHREVEGIAEMVRINVIGVA